MVALGFVALLVINVYNILTDSDPHVFGFMNYNMRNQNIGFSFGEQSDEPIDMEKTV